ncbi:hypothetical protein [Geoglobus acetivorans]|uniref:hypothetical protein n=1 Tax=Geoglobus acetivorans TaxID=565033 RepID=UPI0011DDA73E
MLNSFWFEEDYLTICQFSTQDFEKVVLLNRINRRDDKKNQERDVLNAVREYIPNLSDFVEKKLLEFLSYVNHPLGVEWSSPAGATLFEK